MDSFFIINGLMFSRYANSKEAFDWKTKIMQRLKAVWIPYALICTLGTSTEFLFYHNNVLLVQYLPRMIFLQAFYRSGIPSSLGPLWYIPVYLLVFLVFSLLLSHWGRDRLDGVSILLAVFSFLAIIAKSPSGSWNYTWEPGLFGVVPIGVLRGFMGFPLGYGIGRILSTHSTRKSFKNGLCTTALQICTLTVCIAILYMAPVDYVYDAPYLVASLLLIGSLWAQKGIVYYILSRVSPVFTGLSESIYFCHCFVLTILIKVMGRRPESILELALYLCAVISAAVVLQKAVDCLRKAASMPKNSEKEAS